MLAALLFAACSCVSHEPLFTTPRMAQDSFAVYEPGGGGIERIDKIDGRVSHLMLEPADAYIWSIDVDGALLYFATSESLRAVSVFGGPPVDLAAVAGRVMNIGHDAAAIYWVETDSGRIRRMDKRSRLIDTVVDGMTAPFAPSDVVAFDEHSIFTTAINGGVVRVDKLTGARTQMTPPASYKSAIFVDEMNVYVGGDSYMPKSGGPLVKFARPGMPHFVVGVAGGRLIVSTTEVLPHDPFSAGIMVGYLDMYDLCTGASTRISARAGGPLTEFAVDTCTVYMPSDPVTPPGVCIGVDSYIDSIEPPQASAAGGTLLTIDGTGFSPDARVSIGPFTGTELSITPSRITALSGPAFAGAAILRVSDGRQCTAKPYVILPPPRREASAH